VEVGIEKLAEHSVHGPDSLPAETRRDVAVCV